MRNSLAADLLNRSNKWRISLQSERTGRWNSEREAESGSEARLKPRRRCLTPGRGHASSVARTEMEGEEYRAIMQAWDDLGDGIPRGMAMEEAIPSSTTWYCRFLPLLFPSPSRSVRQSPLPIPRYGRLGREPLGKRHGQGRSLVGSSSRASHPTPVPKGRVPTVAPIADPGNHKRGWQH